jgi:HD superfamily phosphodiesterase
MTNQTFNQIIEDIKQHIIGLAKKNHWLDFYELHQLEVVRCAEKLLKEYKADRKIVILACWLHDVAKYSVSRKGGKVDSIHAVHHILSRNFAVGFLEKYGLFESDIKKIGECVLRHRNSGECMARTIEEKIVAAADTMSHFESIFYFAYFHYYPEHGFKQMAEKQIEKLDRDWRDLGLLPRARALVKARYRVVRQMHEDFLKSVKRNAA